MVQRACIKEKNQRRHERILVDSRVELSWTNEAGAPCYTRGKVVDASESGIRVEVGERIPLRTRLQIKAPSLGIHGTGSVRFCRSKAMGYQIGLEFLGGFTWTKNRVDPETA